jgi:lipopolysaccharide export system protein LptA
MKHRFWLYALIVALAAPSSAAAQNPRAAAAAPPQAAGPAQGLLQNDNQDQPIQIDAATLDVRDKEKIAIFSGDVQVVQGDTTIKCQKLVVSYGPEPGAAGTQRGGNKAVASVAPPANAAQGAQQGAPQTGAVPTRSQDIRKVDATGGVTVISKDQNAKGDRGEYDLKKKTITLIGNVTVSQGKNVLHGERVVVDTVTGNAHFDSVEPSTANGRPRVQPRVQAVIQPTKDEKGGPSNVMSIVPAPKAN